MAKLLGVVKLLWNVFRIQALRAAAPRRGPPLVVTVHPTRGNRTTTESRNSIWKKWKNTPILNEMARHGVGGIFVFQTFSSYPLTNTTYLPSAVLGTLAAHWPSKKVRSAGLLFRHAGPFRGTVPVQSCPINEVNLFETPVHFDSHCILPSCVTFSSLNEDLSK